MAGEKDSVIHTTSGSLFSPEQTGELFNKVKGHSALAKLSAQKPIPFSGTDTFVFSMDGEAAIVAEGANKPAGKASFDKVTIKPLKFVYQHRLTEEFVNMADEKQLPYLQAFLDGFAKKMARALDIAAMHGIDPNTKTTAAAIGSNCLDSAVPTASVIAGTDNPAADLQSAVDAVQNLDCEVTGMALSPKFAASMGKMKQTSTSNVVLYPEFAFGSRPDSFNGMGVDVNNTVSFNASFAASMGKMKQTSTSNVVLYPEFAFGSRPDSFNGMGVDVNNTVSFNASATKGAVNPEVYIGDFQNAFRWGYADTIKTEIIPYGNPDGQGDLKQSNQIVLRAEAYIGWGFLNKNAFSKITSKVASA